MSRPVTPWNCMHAGAQDPSMSRRYFSDNLMGYSPMAPSTPTPSASSLRSPDAGASPKHRMPTAHEVTTSGGVWAPTSAKRDRLGELKVALTDDQKTLDDAATPEEKLDLYLADGLKLVAQTADTVAVHDLESVKELQELSEWLVQEQTKQPEIIFDERQFMTHMDFVGDKISSLLTRRDPTALQEVRDFFDPANAIADEIPQMDEVHLRLQDSAFEDVTLRFRLMLAQAAAEHAKVSWKTLTTVSDADVDRSAVKGEVVPPQGVSIARVYKYIFEHASGTCYDRVEAAWALMDRDGDGLLDESEMNDVAFLCLAPVQEALNKLFEQSIDASPTRAPLPELGSSVVPDAPQGFRTRRKEKKIKKLMLKMFRNATKNHFIDEVEINHRLRCIYAWAEKEHQSNKLESVLVEDEGWTGRKRYVELSPKISLPEFREVQQEHFTHLDRIGKEILGSFREDLWVQQGKGRQRSELIKDSLMFLTVVSVADYLILAY